jgi:hypothetical protein
MTLIIKEASTPMILFGNHHNNIIFVQLRPNNLKRQSSESTKSKKKRHDTFRKSLSSVPFPHRSIAARSLAVSQLPIIEREIALLP